MQGSAVPVLIAVETASIGVIALAAVIIGCA